MRKLWWIALLVTACYHWESSGGVSDRNGVMYWEDTALPHSRWVQLAVPEDTSALMLESATEDITLSAGGPALRAIAGRWSSGRQTLRLASAMPLIRLSQHASAVICPVRHFWTSMLSWSVHGKCQG